MTTPTLLSRERLARIFGGRILASDKDEILAHIAALEADSAAKDEAFRLYVKERGVEHDDVPGTEDECPQDDMCTCPRIGAALLEEHRKALEPLWAVVDGLAQEMERTLHKREQTGGMSVPDHGDFCNAPLSMLGRMRWWVREMREALGGRPAALLARARNEGLERAAAKAHRAAEEARLRRDAINTLKPSQRINYEIAEASMDTAAMLADDIRALKEPEE